MEYYDRWKSRKNAQLNTEEQSEEGFYVEETKLEIYEKLEQLRNNKPKAPSLIIKWKKSIKLLEKELA